MAKRAGLVLATVATVAAQQYPCSASIPGPWQQKNQIYNATWNQTGGPGGFSFTYTAAGYSKMWSSMYGNFNADNTTAIAYFNNGHVGHGNVSLNCDVINWDDGSTWTALTPPPYAVYNVHLCPHTHDDVGWDETYLQYYYGNGPLSNHNVSKIISQVVKGLLADPRRRFSYVEQAYFQIWYETQAPDVQAQVQGLVASGQLVFLNGGWSMHDEANPTFVDMLDNTAVGQRAILENFGASALPKTTWQIDPFGHSGFQGVLSSGLGGYNGVMWAREPGEFKSESKLNDRLERVWLPSQTLGGSVATFQGTFVYGYGTPGPASRCGGYGNISSCNYTWGAIDAPNIIADVIGTQARSTRGNHILYLLGSDFQWENAVVYNGSGDFFAYVDGVRDALNKDPRINAFYSTPADYVAAKLANTTSLPLLTHDIFPYNDDTAGHNMWSGYFTSRPAFKAYVRESSAYHQTARQLQALAGGVTGLGESNPLFALERTMGVAQHHDSVAGTAKQNVNDDYEMLLEAARTPAYGSITSSFATVTGYNSSSWALCPLANVTLCAALEAALPVVATVYNALGQASTATPIRVPVGLPSGVASWAVQDDSGAAVVAQLVPLSPRDTALRALYNGSAAPVQWLCFTAALPAAGFAAFFLTPVASTALAPATHASVVMAAPRSADTVLSNGRLSVTISAATGFMSIFSDAQTGVSIPLEQSWLFYTGFNGSYPLNGSTQASGAYIFRPSKETADPVSTLPATTAFVTGPVVNESWATFAYVTQETRLWAGASDVEVEWTVGPVDVSLPNNQSHEVVTRYNSPGLATNATWVNDANCRESQTRIRNFRYNWTVDITEPVAGNYVPVNCLLRTTDPSTATLAVAVDRSQGGSSLTDGALEFMVHRRMLVDDHRGVGEPLNEPGVDGKGLITRGRHWLLAAPPASAPAAYKALHVRSLSLPSTVLAYAPLGALTPAQWLASYTPRATVLTAPLPPNVHLTTLHVQNETTLLLRLSHMFDAGEDPVLSGPVTVELTTLLRPLVISSAVDMTLPGTLPLAAAPRTVYKTDGGAQYTVPVLPVPPAGSTLSVTLGPQDTRTFMCTVARA